jgi:hypothetical protein
MNGPAPASALRVACVALLLPALAAPAARAQAGRPAPGVEVPAFDLLLQHPVVMKPALRGVHPRVFFTAADVEGLRTRARTTHRAEWQRALAALPPAGQAPPAPPGPQERRSQNNVAYAIAGYAIAWTVDQRPEHLAAARAWTLAAIDYEPWGYTYYKPNVDLAAGHLLYAIGWAYDLLHDRFSAEERVRIRISLERHAGLVAEYFAPQPGRRFNFTQNHNFIPMAGLGVAALALMGESAEAPKWAALARAHHHRANQLLSPDGYYYEGLEYWIFSIPWLVHFYDAWEHVTGESLWELGPARNWKHYLAHAVLPDGQRVFDFGDIWEGPLTRAGKGEEYGRLYPGGTLQSNFNVLYRVASRFADPEAQAVAARLAGFGHSNLEEYWTLMWRDPGVAAAPMSALPTLHHFEDAGVIYWRSDWGREATAFAFKAGPPEGHRVAGLRAKAPEWRLDSGHSHPDNNGFIVWARGRYLTGDTGYAGAPHARHHNTITVDGIGQGTEAGHDVWREMDYGTLDGIRIERVEAAGEAVTIVADAAAAYPAPAGVTRFRRTFRYQAPLRFNVTDEIDTSQPRRIQWYLQSDTPVTVQGRSAHLGTAGPGAAALVATVETPTDSVLTAAPTELTAPGRPGSITSGRTDQRGYHLKVETAPGTRHRIEVSLHVDEAGEPRSGR